MLPLFNNIEAYIKTFFGPLSASASGGSPITDGSLQIVGQGFRYSSSTAITGEWSEMM